MTKIQIRPQPGKQELFLASSADIVIYGGAAGGGKSVALLLECIRHVDNPEFGAIIFRRNTTHIKAEGGLWDTSEKFYYHLNGSPKEQKIWTFPSGSKVTLTHLEYERTVYDYQGAQIPLICFDELTHFCMTPDTEVLTADGWKLLKDVKVNESVPSLSSDREVQYKPVTDVYEYDYDGDLVVVNQSHGISFRVTPNHKILINRQDKDKSLGLKRADELSNDTVPRTGDWKGKTQLKKKFIVPTGRGYGTNTNAASQVDMMDWLLLLGWYLAEGCCFRQKNRTRTRIISIRQTGEEGKKQIRDLLNRLPWRYYENKKHGQFIISSSQLYEELAPLGNTYTKRIPRYVFKLDKKYLKALWDGFVAGDGYIQKTGGVSIGLANEGLIDDLQELAFLLGRVTSKGYDRTKTGFDVWRLHASSEKRHSTQIKNHCISRERYKGKVHCIEVADNHNFYVRHNGRCFWSGNSKKQFFYMLTRNRSTCGVKPYIRATTNPDADSWVAEFISWWIDQETGYAIDERAGIVRYFLIIDDKVLWADTKQELIETYNASATDIKSFTFIPSNLQDNKILMERDPTYIANLKAQDRVERERLLNGNWKIRPSAGLYFKREYFNIVDTVPAGARKVRYWDLAATEKTATNDPDWTAGVKMSCLDGKYYIEHVERMQRSPLFVEQAIKNISSQDGRETMIGISQDPGQAGKAQSQQMVAKLAGYTVRTPRETGDKVTRASPFSAQCEAGNVFLLRGAWNEAYLNELENFPPDNGHDDQVDASSGAFNMLAAPLAKPRIRSL